MVGDLYVVCLLKNQSCCVLYRTANPFLPLSTNKGLSSQLAQVVVWLCSCVTFSTLSGRLGLEGCIFTLYVEVSVHCWGGGTLCSLLGKVVLSHTASGAGCLGRGVI